MNSSEEVRRNRAVVERFLEETHSGHLEVIEQTVSPKIVTHGLFGMDPDSLEGYRYFFQVIGNALQEMYFSIDAMVAEGDQVAVRFSLSAIHGGELLGIPASGRSVRFSGMVIYRLAQGLIRETWLYPDHLALQQQLDLQAA